MHLIWTKYCYTKISNAKILWMKLMRIVVVKINDSILNLENSWWIWRYFSVIVIKGVYYFYRRLGVFILFGGGSLFLYLGGVSISIARVVSILFLFWVSFFDIIFIMHYTCGSVWAIPTYTHVWSLPTLWCVWCPHLLYILYRQENGKISREYWFSVQEESRTGKCR